LPAYSEFLDSRHDVYLCSAYRYCDHISLCSLSSFAADFTSDRRCNGLALFTIGGAQIAEAQHPPIAIVIFMGTITGAARGVVRDVLCGDIPILMRPSELYARTAIHEKLSCFAPIPKFTTGVARPAAGAVGAESALWPSPPPHGVSAPHVISILAATYGCIKTKRKNRPALNRSIVFVKQC
jgi:hypothetical protein